MSMSPTCAPIIGTPITCCHQTKVEVAKNLPQKAEKMALLLKLYSRLRLKMSEAKSAVASVFQRNFVGHRFWVSLE